MNRPMIRNLTTSLKKLSPEMLAASALFIFALLHLIWRLCDYSGCFTEPEVHQVWFPSVMLNGKGFSLGDFKQAIDAWGMDGDSRPRFLSYYLAAIAIKTRIALWDIMPPHPSFTPLWPLTLLLAPWLLFRFLKNELASNAPALAGAALYLLSAGYLSSATMFFHPGKPLTNLTIIATLLIASYARKALPDDATAMSGILPRSSILFYLFLLPLLLMADETALFAMLILPIWAYRYFIPNRFVKNEILPCLLNSFIMAFPVIIYAIMAFVVAPLLCSTYMQRAYSFGDYMARYRDFGKAGLSGLIRHTTTLFAAPLVPWQFLNVRIPIGTDAELRLGVFIVVLVMIGSIFALLWRDRSRRNLVTRVALLLFFFLLFQTFVAAHHPYFLSVTGFYYGAIFSVLVSILFALLFASATAMPRGTLLVICMSVYIACIQTHNYSKLNRSWKEHSNSKTMGFLAQSEYNPFLPLTDTTHLTELFYQDSTSFYAHDIAQHLRQNQISWSYQLWKNKNDIKKLMLPQHILALDDIWVLIELYYWRTPVQLVASVAGDSPPPVTLNSKILQNYKGTLLRAQYGTDNELPIPFLAFKNIKPVDFKLNVTETIMTHPWLNKELTETLQFFKEVGITYIVVSNDNSSLIPGKINSTSHNQFIQAYNNRQLNRYGIVPLGDFQLAGHPVTLLEILK